MPAKPLAEFVERTKCINCAAPQLVELSAGNFVDQPLADFLKADPSGEDISPYFRNARWSLVRCSECSQMFHRRILNAEWNERRFSQWMDAKSIEAFEDKSPTPKSVRKFETARRYVGHVLRIDALTKSRRTNSEAVRLLDFGCGWGRFLEVCKTFGFDAVGVDRSIPRAEGASIEIFSSLDEINKSVKFHAITLFEVLEHLDDPGEALEALAGHIVKGGILVLETPDCSGVADIKTHADYLKIHPLEHINAFTHETLKSIAQRRGFINIPRGPDHVTTDIVRVLKREAKHRLGRDSNSTQLYFRKI